MLIKKKSHLEDLFRYLDNIDIIKLFINLIDKYNITNFDAFKYRPCFEPLFLAYINEVFQVFQKNSEMLNGLSLPNQSILYDDFVFGKNLMYKFHQFFQKLLKNYDIFLLDSKTILKYFVI